MPLARAVRKCAVSAGTPRPRKNKTLSRKVFSRWLPSSRVTPASFSLAIASPISFSVRESVAVTRAPRAAQKSDVATPVLASPTTSTRFPRKSIPPGIVLYQFHSTSNVVLPQLQRRQRKQRKYKCGNPKSHDDFRFAPSQQFKMMVDGRHAEYALPAQFE